MADTVLPAPPPGVLPGSAADLVGPVGDVTYNPIHGQPASGVTGPNNSGIGNNPNNGMGTVDASQYLGQIQGSVADAKNAANAGWGAAASASTGAGQIAAGQNIIDASTMMTQLQRRADDARVYAMFGTNPEAPTKIAILAKETSDLEDQLRQQTAMIRDKQKLNFLDNPVQWLVNQVTLPFDFDAANTIKGNIDQELDVIHKLNMSTSEGVQADAAAAYNTSTQLLVGTSMKNLGQAQASAADAMQRAASTGVAGAGTVGQLSTAGFATGELDVTKLGLSQLQLTNTVDIENRRLALSTLSFETATALDKARYGLSKEQFDFNKTVETNRMNVDAARLDLAQKQFAFSQGIESSRLDIEGQRLAQEKINSAFTQLMQSHADARATEQHAVAMDIQKLSLGTDQEKVYARQDMNNRLQQVATLMGTKPFTIDEVMMMQDGRQKQTLMSLAQQPDIQSGTYGVTPTDSINTIVSQKARLDPGPGALYSKLVKITEAETLHQGLLAKQYTPEQELALKNDAIKNAEIASYKNIRDSDSGDLYAPTSLRKVLAIPEVAATSLAAPLSVIANTSDRSGAVVPTRSEDIIAAAKAKILTPGSGYTPAMAAAEVNTIFSAMVKEIDTRNQFQRFGMSTLESGHAYNTAVSAVSGFRSTEVVDTLNKAQMTTYFTRFATQNLMNKGAGISGATP